MSTKLTVSYEGAGATLYVILRRASDGYAWNGTAMEAWVNGNIGTYDIPLIDQGGDLYSVTVPSALPRGVEYEAIYYQQLAGAPAITDDILTRERFMWRGSISESAPSGDAIWYYADVVAVEDILGQTDLSIIGDPDNDGDIDYALVERAGEWADAFMDARLKMFGFTTPLVGTDTPTDLLLRDISAKLVISQLNQSRALIIASRSPLNQSGVDKVMMGWWREANSMLVSIGSGILSITADRAYSTPSAAVPAFSTPFTVPVSWWPLS